MKQADRLDHNLANRGVYEVLLAVFHAQPALLAPIELATMLGLSPSGMTNRLDLF